MRRAAALVALVLAGSASGAVHAAAATGALGDHTWSHRSVAKLGRKGLRAEIGRTRAAEIVHTGRRIDLLRPPYGIRTRAADPYVRGLGMLEVLWAVADSGSGIRGGSIVVLHETHADTLPLLRRILRDRRRRRLRAVTVPELLANARPKLTEDARGVRTDCR